MEKQQIEKYKDTRNLRPHPKRSGRFHSANRLSVMAIFRNEAHLFKEWIEHYYSEGVQHFYLINHNSTDNYLDVIRPYMNDISLIHTKKIFPQREGIYDQINSVVDSDWLLVCDIDEFVYARRGYNTILDFLKDKAETKKGGRKFNQVIIPSVDFHNGGVEKQPKSVVDTFTIRTDHTKSRYMENPPISLTKGLVYTGNENTNVEQFLVHGHNVSGRTVNGNLTKSVFFEDNPYRKANELVQEFRRPDEELIKTSYLKLNHYRFQSKEFYWNDKQYRGDVTGFWAYDNDNNLKEYNHKKENHPFKGENWFEHNWRIIHQLPSTTDTELLEKKKNRVNVKSTISKPTIL